MALLILIPKANDNVTSNEFDNFNRIVIWMIDVSWRALPAISGSDFL